MSSSLAVETLSFPLLFPHGGLELDNTCLAFSLAIPPEGLTTLVLPLFLSRMMVGGFVGLMLSNSVESNKID